MLLSQLLGAGAPPAAPAGLPPLALPATSLAGPVATTVHLPSHRGFHRRRSSLSGMAAWSTTSSANSSPCATPVASVPSSPRESPVTPRRSLLDIEDDARMAYLRSKLTRLCGPADTVAVSADMEIPRAALKRRGAICLEEPNELMNFALETYAKRPRRLPSASDLL